MLKSNEKQLHLLVKHKLLQIRFQIGYCLVVMSFSNILMVSGRCMLFIFFRDGTVTVT